MYKLIIGTLGRWLNVVKNVTIHVSTYRTKFSVLRYKVISYEYFILRIGQLDLLYCFTRVKILFFFLKSFC